jgi:hypothetical protein
MVWGKLLLQFSRTTLIGSAFCGINETYVGQVLVEHSLDGLCKQINTPPPPPPPLSNTLYRPPASDILKVYHSVAPGANSFC